jgi:hypothetical protein
MEINNLEQILDLLKFDNLKTLKSFVNCLTEIAIAIETDEDLIKNSRNAE